MKIGNFNQLKHELDIDGDDIDQIVALITPRCRHNTKKRVRSILTYGPSTIEKYGILERLMRDSLGVWDYTAGQSYPDEIRTVRECILGK